MNVHYARYIVCHVVYTYSDSSTVADQGGAPFFRVAPDFVVQFGIAGTPGKNSKWTNPIKDDPVVQSNIAWTVSYATAGPDTRTTQLFINLQDNSGLDSQGFAPVGVILDRESQETVNMIMNPTPGDSMGLDQDQLMKKGDEWVKEEGYKCNYIRTTTTHINNDVPNY
jgi:peptidyl-prolyl cis-trans isomerase A (cyclophilin A)